MNEQKVRIGIALLCGILLTTFGVFLFSNFRYRNLDLSLNVFELMLSGDFRDFANGIYTLFNYGILTNMFALFSEEIQTLGFFGVIFGEKLWPVIVTWFSTGFVVGCIVKGLKYSFIINAIVFVIIFLLWFIAGLFAGADISILFTIGTLGKLATSLIFLITGALIGGLVGGKNYNN